VEGVVFDIGKFRRKFDSDLYLSTQKRRNYDSKGMDAEKETNSALKEEKSKPRKGITNYL